MQKIVNILNVKFAPAMEKINHNIWILTLKDSLMQVLSLILFGSIITVLSIIKNYIPQFPDLTVLNNYTFGLVSIFVAFLIPFNLMEKSRLRQLRLVAGFSGLCLFFLFLKPEMSDAGAVFQFNYFGAGGMFVAIVCGVFSGFVMKTVGKFSFFKEDSVVPDFVRRWFDNILPIAIIMVIGWLLIYVFGLDMYKLIQQAFSPLRNFAQTWYGFVLFMFAYGFLYSMGISSWVLMPIGMPIMIAGITENAALVAAGQAPANIFVNPLVFSTYLAFGGIGFTFPLVVMMLRAKSHKMKALGKACLVPSIFNINEPVVFGCIAWNPYLMIPMWLNTIILPLITYAGCSMGLFPIPYEIFTMWYCPYPISTWITTHSIVSFILLAINIIIATGIWYPFFKLYDKQVVKEEQEAAQKKVKGGN